MYPEDLSSCGCPPEPTNPPVTPPAPPVCAGEPCAEVMNTSCVRYDGPDIPGVAANGDNMTDVLQGLADGGNIGGANNFILEPADSTIQINGANNPVVIDTPGQVVTLSAIGAQGEQGPPGQSVTVEGYTATYTTLLTDFPTPDPLTVVMLTDVDSGVNGTIYVYDPTSTSADVEGWVNLGQITGPPGSPGDTGPAGPTGTSILYGGSNPVAGVGNNGDFFLNTTTYMLYGPKVGGAWPTSGVSLIGPAGADGADGATGNTGPAGAAATIAVGTTTTGAAGSSAAVTNVGTSQNAVFNFVIPQGAAGVAGSKILSGTGTPTGGFIGDYYLNTATSVLYGPKVTAGWPSTGLLLKGADGAAGADGADGATGAPGPAGQAVVMGFRTITDASSSTLKRVQGGYTGGSSDPSDVGKMVECNLGSSDLDFIVPNLTDSSFPVGGQLIITRLTAKRVRIIGDTGVTVTSADSMNYLRSINSSATLIKKTATSWYLIGDISPY